MILAFPSPLPVNVVRDAWDWVGLVVGIVGAVIGTIALVVALRANAHAKEAAADSRRMVAAERRRAFDLEVLRDLVESLQDLTFLHQVADRPALLEERVGPALSMLPTDDLPLWRASPSMTWTELADAVGATAEEKDAFAKRKNYGGSSGPIGGKLRDHLLRELDVAIRARRDVAE